MRQPPIISKFDLLLSKLTLDQAIAWRDTNEKILYVDDDILAPENFRLTDSRLARVEHQFDCLLNQAKL